MQDEKKLDLILEKYYNRYNRYNTKVLETLGNAVKQFDGLKASEAHEIAQKLKYGTDIDQLVNELSEMTKKTNEEIYELLDQVAIDNVEFAETYAKAKGKDLITYESNEQLQDIVNAIAQQTTNNMANITNTQAIGFTLKQEEKAVFKPLKKVYNDLIDEAVYNVATGTKTYQASMTNVIKQLADSGVRVNENKITYESGYTRRIDTAVRQNVLDGVRQVNMQVQEEVGSRYGADGVEISAHSPCAEDHLHIQGKQFSKKEFERINGDLERPIGYYNCRHFVFSIILGVNLPSYSRSTLRQYERESTQPIKYEGKTYTKYEATQVQRQMETKIREQKDRQIIAKASGNKELISEAQRNITAYTNKYVDFSNKAGLEVYKDRLRVSGYKRVNVDKFIYSENEMKAIKNYISSDAIKVNSLLRENKQLNSTYKALVRDLDTALIKTPTYSGNIVRTMVMDDPETFIKQNMMGSTYSTNQYLSFSATEKFQKGANIEIYVKNSKKGRDFTKLNEIGEGEVLYERNQEFIVDKVLTKNGVYRIYWTEK